MVFALVFWVEDESVGVVSAIPPKDRSDAFQGQFMRRGKKPKFKFQVKIAFTEIAIYNV